MRRTDLGLLVGIVVALAVAGAAAAWTVARGATPATELTVDIRYSHFEPSQLSVPVGVPVTIVLRNEDPIDHEWILGDAPSMSGIEPARSPSTLPGRLRSRSPPARRAGRRSWWTRRARSRMCATSRATRRTA